MIQPKKGQTAHTDKLSLVFPRFLPLRFPGYSGCALVTVCVPLKIGGYARMRGCIATVGS